MSKAKICGAITLKGTPCKRRAWGKSGLCSYHSKTKRIADDDGRNIYVKKRIAKNSKDKNKTTADVCLSVSNPTMRDAYSKSPTEIIAEKINDALDPTKSHGKTKTLKDMTKKELKKIENDYKTKINKTPNWHGEVIILSNFTYSLIIRFQSFTAKIIKEKICENSQIKPDSPVGTKGILEYPQDPTRKIKNFIAKIKNKKESP